jgi:multiple sugar transport system substrate-binding protein
MAELELSIMSSTPQPPQALVAALGEFEAQSELPVRLRVLPWVTAWAELVKVTLYKTGPDVSQIGTTWIDSFSTMQALRHFAKPDVESLGGPTTFLPSSWRSGSIPGQRHIWAIPWLSDTRVIYYRRDWLKEAGIDERTAFQTHAQLVQTLQRLEQNGVTMPWTMPTSQERPTLHTLAPWVWGAGGHFMSADGKRTCFGEPEALAGLRDYFSLHRYIAPDARNLNDSQAITLFRLGQAAATVSGHWLLNSIRQGQEAIPEVVANLGVARMPGVPFVGGSNLVVWKHCPLPQRALELVRFLTSQRVQTHYLPQTELLPARLDALDAPLFTDDPFYQVIGDSLRTGNGFRAPYMWGLIEDGIVATLNALWIDVFADSGLDLAQVIDERMGLLSQSLNRTLAERG